MQDVVWRADTGQYHARATGAPVLLPPMLDGSSRTAAPSSEPAFGSFWRWLASPEATNLLLLLILLCLVLRRD